MFREALPPNAGMLFLFSEPGIHKFWMKNTMIPLDIIWMDSAGKVVFVSANTPQCRADPCPTLTRPRLERARDRRRDGEKREVASRNRDSVR
jgi:uncharacterized membrane protein (UPF0127 family)